MLGFYCIYYFFNLEGMFLNFFNISVFFGEIVIVYFLDRENMINYEIFLMIEVIDVIKFNILFECDNIKL